MSTILIIILILLLIGALPTWPYSSDGATIQAALGSVLIIVIILALTGRSEVFGPARRTRRAPSSFVLPRGRVGAFPAMVLSDNLRSGNTTACFCRSERHLGIAPRVVGADHPHFTGRRTAQ